MEKKDILIIIILFFTAFFMREAGVSTVGFEWDEWIYRDRIVKILANDWIPNANIFSGPSPFVPYIGALVTTLFDGSLNTLRMISVIFGSLTVPFLYLFGKTIYDRTTGVLSALLLCFSGYHLFYSRILMLEAFTLFFVVTFLYFFWLSQRSDNRKGIAYAIIAGAMMGLAIDAKYLPFFLVPTILIYTFWTKGISLKTLNDKIIILTLLSTFLFFIPMCIFLSIAGSNPIDFFIIERFETALTRGGDAAFGTGLVRAPLIFFAIDKVLMVTIEKITETLAWGNWILIPTWGVIFKLSTTLLFFVTLYFYLVKFKDREKEGSFLMISILILYTLLLFIKTAKYYLIYSFPIYFVMVAHLTKHSFDNIVRTRSYKNILNIFIILLTVIILFSYIVIGVNSHQWDEGEHSWEQKTLESIKSDVAKSGYEGNILIGMLGLFRTRLNDCPFFEDNNASIVWVVKICDKKAEVDVDLEKIDKMNPRYLIISDSEYCFISNEAKKKIFEDYTILFRSNTPYSYNGFVLKRKNIQPIQPAELTPIKDGKEGEISEDIFRRSVPSVMKIGKVYIVLVRIENTGTMRKNFFTKVYSGEYTVFMEDSSKKVALDKGSTCLLKFKIVPIREYAGKLPITVDIHSISEEGEIGRKIDSSTDYIYFIR